MSILDAAPRDAWLWLAASLGLAIFWSHLVWVFLPWVKKEEDQSSEAASFEEKVVHRIATWHLAPALLQVARLLYYIGLPASALFWGRDALIGRLFGLQPLLLPLSPGTEHAALLSTNWVDWLHDFGWAAALGLVSGMLLLLAGLAHRRALPTERDPHPTRHPAFWETVREATYRETHWAFYRNAPIVAFGLYWGVWVGLALVALEALADPIWRGGLSDFGRVPPQLLRASLAMVSSLLFLQTQNLWLAIAVHSAVAWGLRDIYGATTNATRHPLPTET